MQICGIFVAVVVVTMQHNTANWLSRCLAFIDQSFRGIEVMANDHVEVIAGQTNYLSKFVGLIRTNYLCPGHRPRAQVIKCVGFFFFLYYFSSARKWTNCAIVPLRPCGLRMLNEAWMMRVRCEWDFLRMFIVMSVKPLTDELLKVNSTLQIIFPVTEDKCSGGQRSLKWGRQHFKTSLR